MPSHLSVEDHAGPGAAEGLVRRSGYHVAVLERTCRLLRDHQPRDVRHVTEQSDECEA